MTIQKSRDELLEIIEMSNISTEKLLKLTQLIEAVQYDAYSEGYEDGYGDATVSTNITEKNYG